MDLRTLVRVAEQTEQLDEYRDTLEALAMDWDVELAESLAQAMIASAPEKLVGRLPFGGKACFSPDEDVFLGRQITDIRFNDIQLGQPIGISKKLLEEGCHVVIAGETRHGKTQLAKLMLRQIPFPKTVFDFDGEYLGLVSTYARGDFLAATAREMRLNPLEPLPFEHPMDTISRFSTVVRSSWFIRDGGENYLSEQLVRMFKERGIFEGSRNFPTLINVLEDLKAGRTSRNDRTAAFRESLINRFSGLCAKLGPTYNCVQGHPMEELLSRNICLYLSGLSGYERIFFVTSYCDAAAAYKQRQQLSGKVLQPNCFLFEEAHLLYTAPDRADIGNVGLYEFVRMCGRKKITCIILDNVFASVPREIQSNTPFKIFFRLAELFSKRSAAASISLSQEQEEFLSKLSKQCAVLHSPLSEDPILLQVPSFSVPAFMPEEEFEARKSLVLSIPFVPAGPAPQVGKNKELLGPDGLEEKHLKILKTVPFDPFSTMEEHAENMKIAASTFSKWAKELREQGLVTEEIIHTGVRGGQVKCLRPSEKGVEFLKGLKITVPDLPGDGGFEHRFWQNRIMRKEIKEPQRRKLPVFGKIEHSLTPDGKRSDVGVIRPDEVGREERIAFEVAIPPDLGKEVSNVAKDLEGGWTRVVVCVKNEEIGHLLAEKLSRELNLSDYDDRFEVRLLQEYTPVTVSDRWKKKNPSRS